MLGLAVNRDEIAMLQQAQVLQRQIIDTQQQTITAKNHLLCHYQPNCMAFKDAASAAPSGRGI